MKKILLVLLLVLPSFSSCESTSKGPSQPAAIMKIPEGAEVATFGGGCFWCIESVFKQLDGVYAAQSGYEGGHVRNPTYEQVSGGKTGHAEVVKVVFDPKKISYEKLLEWFWDIHDPTTLNRQGNDSGTQYRSVIYYYSEAQKDAAEASKTAAAGKFTSRIVTDIAKATEFYPAEEYHQDYYFQNKSKNSYCTYVIEPKLKKLKLKH